MQRWITIALVPFGLYVIASVLRFATSGRMSPGAWLALPVGALLVILFMLFALAHELVRLRSILLEYVRTRTRLLAAELLFRVMTVSIAGASVVTMVRIFLSP